MPGGLTQLVAHGVQDVALTGSPTFTYFKKRAARSTSFACESIRQTISNPSGFSTITISRNADLVYGLWLEVKIKKASATPMAYPAEAYVKNVELEIGGQRIDYVDSDWCAARRELYLNTDQRETYHEMNNFRPDDPIGFEKTFYLTIPFFFTEGDVSKALPLIALQYHEVKINFNFAPEELTGCSFVNQEIYADYIFLDTNERRLFAQQPHEYLIEQTQIQSANFTMSRNNTRNFRISMNFNHPTRYLCWYAKTDTHGAFSASQQVLEANDNYAPFRSARIQFNGQDRFTTRQGSYFRFVQPLTAFGRAPSAGVYVYCFGLGATGQNSGTMNFSRVDNAVLILSTKVADAATIDNISTENQTVDEALTAFKGLTIVAKNFNVLRVASGMGGLAYAN